MHLYVNLNFIKLIEVDGLPHQHSEFWSLKIGKQSQMTVCEDFHSRDAHMGKTLDNETC